MSQILPFYKWGKFCSILPHTCLGCTNMVQDGPSQWNPSPSLACEWSAFVKVAHTQTLGLPRRLAPRASWIQRAVPGQRGRPCSPFILDHVCARQAEEDKHLYWVLPLWLVWWPHSGWNGDPSMTRSHGGNRPGEVHWILMPPVRLLQALQASAHFVSYSAISLVYSCCFV